MSNTTKNESRSRGVAALLESVAELQGFIDKGMTVADIKRHYQRHHPDRIRTVRIPAPSRHSPASVRKLRLSMGLSQATFAELIGVSAILVQSWERGVRTPSRLARRLLDTICRDPAGWLDGLRETVQPKVRRVG